MSITTEPIPLSYSGDDLTVAFPISWKYFTKSDVVATLRSAAGAETTWVLNTNYTLSAAGVDSGGTLTATTAPATGATLVISLDPPNTQDSSLPIGGPFPSSTVEDELDQAAQRDGKLETLFNRALRVPKTDLRTDTDLELPIDTVRASKYLYFDGNGVPTAAAGTATLGETGLLSQDTESELTIAVAGSVTPTVATHSIDTNADAATDNLDTIVTTNLADGRLLLIRGENAARVVTVRHEQGGAGQVHTASGSSVVLGVSQYMLLQRRGADWYEVQISETGDVLLKTGGTMTGDITMTAASIIQAEGAAITAAATTSIWTTDGDTCHITGNTGISSFGTAAQAGMRKLLIIDGTPLLTHAANLNLPGSVDYQCAAGDILDVYADTTTQHDVRVFKQSLSGGRSVVFANGTKTTGTFTPVPANGDMQSYTNGGAHTLAPPALSGTILMTITNDASAGAITTSGFGDVFGDAFTTTNAHIFMCLIIYDGTNSVLKVKALQ